EQQVQGKEENEHMDVKITSLDHAPSRAQRPSRTLRREDFAPYLFILPFGVLFLMCFIVPMLYAIYQSLFRSERNGLGLGAATVSFNGLGNYVDVFHDPNFYAGVGRVLLYGIVQVPVMLGLSLLFALLLDSTVVRFKAVFRLAFFVPYAIPGIIAALLWGYLYDPSLSPIVKGFQALGVPAPDFLGWGTVLWAIANIAPGPGPATTCSSSLPPYKPFRPRSTSRRAWMAVRVGASPGTSKSPWWPPP